MVGDILQPTHLLLILVVALLVLGPKRLPEVGRSLGSGLRDFKAAINGESHEDRSPHAYVEAEPEPDPVPPHDLSAPATEPTGFDLATEAAAPTDAVEPATPTALHEHQLDPAALGDDLHAPAATEDLHAPATDDLPAGDELHAPAANGDLPETVGAAANGDLPETVGAAAPDPARAPVAAASSGFASALASSRQRPADGGAPAADDE